MLTVDPPARLLLHLRGNLKRASDIRNSKLVETALVACPLVTADPVCRLSLSRGKLSSQLWQSRAKQSKAGPLSFTHHEERLSKTFQEEKGFASARSFS